MVEAHRRRQDLVHGAVDNLVRRAAGLGRILHQAGPERLLELAVPGPVGGQSPAPLDQNLGNLRRELAHEARRQPQTVRHGARSEPRLPAPARTPAP